MSAVGPGGGVLATGRGGLRSVGSPPCFCPAGWVRMGGGLLAGLLLPPRRGWGETQHCEALVGNNNKKRSARVVGASRGG